MSATIRWNRLIIEAASDGEFADAIQKNLPKLLELEYEELECDISKVQGIGPEGLSALATGLARLGDSSKHLAIRAPDTLEQFFAKTGLLRVDNLQVEIVRSLGNKNAPVDRTQMPEKDDPQVGEITDASGRIIAGLDDSDRLGEIKKTSSSLGGAAAPLPGGVKNEDMNRRTLVGLPVDFFSDELAPPTRRDDDGIDELIVGQDSISTSADLDDIHDDSDFRDRDASDAPKLKIVWLRDEESGDVKEIQEELVMGRAAPSDWVIDIPTISKRHIRIFRERGRYFLQDLNATNGTFLNRIQLKGPPAVLMPDDSISVAHTLKTPDGARSFTFLSKKP